MIDIVTDARLLIMEITTHVLVSTYMSILFVVSWFRFNCTMFAYLVVLFDLGHRIFDTAFLNKFYELQQFDGCKNCSRSVHLSCIDRCKCPQINKKERELDSKTSCLSDVREQNIA